MSMKKPLQLLVLATTIADCVGDLLLPFGVCKAGDRLLSLIDDAEEIVDLNTPFEFFGSMKSGLVKAEGYVQELFPQLINFKATNLIVITFDRWQWWFDFTTTFTFQVLIVQQANGKSVALYLYKDIIDDLNRFFTIGVNAGDNVNFRTLCVAQTPTNNMLDETTQFDVCNTVGLYGFILEIGEPTTCIPSLDPSTCPVPPQPHPSGGSESGSGSGSGSGGIGSGRGVVERDNCANCTVASGLGYNPVQGDCGTFWTCVLKKGIKNPENGWVSYKRGCPCDMVWSQKTLTCVDFRSKLSDCSRGDPSQNPCTGSPAGTVLPRPNPKSVMNENLCSGYIRCVQVGAQVLPKYQCCPPDTCFVPDNSLDVPCLEECCAEECSGVDDCDCESKPQVENECAFQSVDGEPTMFMGREVMSMYKCSPGTCWDDDLCTCVSANNTGYDDCIPWVSKDFDGGLIKAVSGLGHQMWLEYTGVDVVPNGALATPYFARFDGDGDFVNLIALANAYIGNTFVVRFFFRLETNNGAPSSDEEQVILTNCFDPRGTTQEDATIDVCVLRQAGTGVGTMLKTTITYNDRVFMIGDSMDTVMLDLTTNLEVDTWYEYWLIYCGEDEVVFTAVLDEGGTVLYADDAIVDHSQFVVVTQSGFVLGTSVEASKKDFDGGIDEVLMYRCKPDEDTDFDADFAAIKTFIG